MMEKFFVIAFVSTVRIGFVTIELFFELAATHGVKGQKK